MNSSVNGLLSQIREKLDLHEAAWGPESAQDVDPESTLSSKAGDGMAHNIQDVGDSMDMFILNVVEHLMAIFDMSEDQALSALEHVAGEMAADGMIPPMPADGAEDAELSRWAGSAKTAGLEAAVLQYCRDHAS